MKNTDILHAMDCLTDNELEEGWIKMNEKKTRRVPKAVKIGLAVAAVVATLTVTAFAATEYGGGWKFRHQTTDDFMGRSYTFLERNDIEGAMVPNEVYGFDPVEDAGNVILPNNTMGAKVIKDENDRVILYLYIFKDKLNLVDEVIDITDDLAASADGTYTYSDLGVGEDGTNWKVRMTVLPVTEDMKVTEGHYGYVLSGTMDTWFYVDGIDKPFTSNFTLDGESWNSWSDSFGNYFGVTEIELVPETWIRHAKVLGNLPEDNAE